MFQRRLTTDFDESWNHLEKCGLGSQLLSSCAEATSDDQPPQQLHEQAKAKVKAKVMGMVVVWARVLVQGQGRLPVRCSKQQQEARMRRSWSRVGELDEQE